jgi:hypothetical protein
MLWPLALVALKLTSPVQSMVAFIKSSPQILSGVHVAIAAMETNAQDASTERVMPQHRDNSLKASTGPEYDRANGYSCQE